MIINLFLFTDVMYQMTIYTGAESSPSTNFIAYINVNGEIGDIGQRVLKNMHKIQNESVMFRPNSVSCELYL
jgi:hypothetical protein